jgi:hypothetical protein
LITNRPANGEYTLAFQNIFCNYQKMSKMMIRPMQITDIPKIKKFADAAIGKNYYQIDELNEIFQKSQFNNKVYSLVLSDTCEEIHGIRITYPPGQWQKGKGTGLNPQKWDTPFESVAYFQSLFIEPKLTGVGWGSKISQHSIQMLKTLGGVKAIVAHSWQESPNDSSRKYLNTLGFKLVATHPFYWKEVDYVCTRCGKPCLCTADEMILYL